MTFLLLLLSPVNGIVTGSIFNGEGHFNLKPVTIMDAEELKRRVGSSEVDEDFTEIVMRFAGEERRTFFPGIGDQVDTPAGAATAFGQWKERMRKRREEALGFTEQLLHGEGMDIRPIPRS